MSSAGFVDNGPTLTSCALQIKPIAEPLRTASQNRCIIEQGQAEQDRKQIKKTVVACYGDTDLQSHHDETG